jgi:hypothetical protein
MIACLMQLGGITMMLGGLFVRLRRLAVMLLGRSLAFFALIPHEGPLVRVSFIAHGILLLHGLWFFHW